VKTFGVRLKIQTIFLLFNMEHFRDQTLSVRRFFIQDLNIVPLKIMIMKKPVLGDDRASRSFVSNMVTMFGNSSF